MHKFYSKVPVIKKYFDLKDNFFTLKKKYFTLKQKYSDLKEKYSDLKEKYSKYRDVIKELRPLAVQTYLGHLADQLGESLQAECYISLLPSTLPVAFQLRNNYGGVIICDNVENVDQDKHSINPGYSPTVMHLVNYSAYGSLYEADRLLTVSEEIEKILKKFNRPTLVLKNYRFYEDVDPAKYLRETCGISNKEVLLFACGTVVKGFEPVLRSLALLPSHYHLAALVRLKPDSYEQEVKSLINFLKLGHRIHILPFVEYDLLASVAADADMGLITHDIANPNVAVSLGNRFFDYLAGELPIVSPAIPDVKKLVDKFGCGQILDPINPENWRDAILTVASDISAFKARARQAKRELTWESQEETFYDFIGRPKTVTMIGFRDLTRYQRFIRMASTLRKYDCRMKMLTVTKGPKLESLLPEVDYYCVERLFKNSIKPPLLRKSEEQ